jgi:hypothetical protein
MVEFGWPLCLFLTASGLAIFSSFISLIMVAEVNRKLPDNEQVNYFFWYLGKFLKVKRLYKQFYPQGRLVLLYYLFIGLAGALMLGLVSAIGFFR